MHFACWIPKATDTYSEYVIHSAFPRQHWLRERASLLLYTYFAFLVFKYYLVYTDERREKVDILWATGLHVQGFESWQGQKFNLLKITKTASGAHGAFC